MTCQDPTDKIGVCRNPHSRCARISVKDLRINDRIRVREVRLIGEEAEQLGVVPTFEALKIAQEKGLDLVEVAPTAIPPVCRLMDYGRFKYEQTKKEREARKNQKVIELKEVRLTPRTDEHDVMAKVKTIQRFLGEGDKVKVTIRFRGRELAHPQLGREVLEEISKNLAGTAVIERPPLMEGRAMFMILSPPGLRSGPPQGVRPPQGIPGLPPGIPGGPPPHGGPRPPMQPGVGPQGAPRPIPAGGPVPAGMPRPAPAAPTPAPAAPAAAPGPAPASTDARPAAPRPGPGPAPAGATPRPVQRPVTPGNGVGAPPPRVP